MNAEGMIDYYTLLDLSPNASKLDIINAYRHAKLTYRKDSIAIYSLYSEEELSTIRKEIDQAYAVLSDREKRRAYDAEHGFAPSPAGEGAREDGVACRSTPNYGAQVEAEHIGGDNVVRLHHRRQADYDPDLERKIQSADAFPGQLLRAVREYHRITLQEIVEHTRISLSYLQAIENEDVHALPAEAYLKGYLGQYAAEIGLEPHRVVQGYPPLCSESD